MPCYGAGGPFLFGNGQRSFFEPAAFESGHELSQKIEPGLLLPGNAAGLSQLCGILLENALQYASPSGKIQVELRAVGKPPGCPFPMRERPFLRRSFPEFLNASTGEKTLKRTVQGSGLPLTKLVVEQQEGHIYAENTRDGHACFILRFFR